MIARLPKARQQADQGGNVGSRDGTADDEPGAASGRCPRRVVLKSVASVLIVLHLIAIAVAPASVPPSSQAQRNAWSVFRPYLQFAYLNHGYHFFAPDPGASSLIDFTVTREDGDGESETVWARMPDKDRIWPRLRYHRHFMLTEFYGGIPPSATEMRQAIAQAYAQQVLLSEGAESVELSHVIHRLSTPEEIRQGRTLDEPDTFQHTPLGRFSLAGSSAAASPAGAGEAQGSPVEPNSAAPTTREPLQDFAPPVPAVDVTETNNEVPPLAE